MPGVSVPDGNDRRSAGPLARWLRDLAMRDRCAGHEIDPAPVSARLPGRGLDGQPCAIVEQRRPGDDGSRTIRGWPAARTRSAEVRGRPVRRDGARWRAGLGDAGRAAVVAARLRRVPGVRHASTQALTGTALVEYDPEATSLARIRVALRGRRRAARRPAAHIERLPKAV
jgi:hypothetical protein